MQNRQNNTFGYDYTSIFLPYQNFSPLCQLPEKKARKGLVIMNLIWTYDFITTLSLSLGTRMSSQYKLSFMFWSVLRKEKRSKSQKPTLIVNRLRVFEIRTFDQTCSDIFKLTCISKKKVKHVNSKTTVFSHSIIARVNLLQTANV